MKEIFQEDENFAGTKGLVFIGEKVLVYRRDANAPKYPNLIDVPGGGKESNETPFETFSREVLEEFGLTIRQEDIVYGRKYKSAVKDNEFGWYLVAELPESDENNIVFGDEGVGYALMGLDEFLKRQDAWPAYQKRAADYLSSTKDTV